MYGLRIVLVFHLFYPFYFVLYAHFEYCFLPADTELVCQIHFDFISHLLKFQILSDHFLYEQLGKIVKLLPIYYDIYCTNYLFFADFWSMGL